MNDGSVLALAFAVVFVEHSGENSGFSVQGKLILCQRVITL